MVLWKRVIPLVCSTRCWEFAFQYMPPVIVTTWGDAGVQSRVKMHEDHMKMKGIKCSLVLYNWMPGTSLLLLHTPSSSPANISTWCSALKPCLQAQATQRTPRFAQLTPRQAGHSRGVKKLHIWLSLLFLLSWSCPAGRELEEVGRRKRVGRGLNLREAGNSLAMGF